MTTITSDEMRELAGRMKEALDKTDRAFELLDNVMAGDQDAEYEYEGRMIPSISKRVKDSLSRAIEDGIINIPEGRIITKVYVDDSGELIIEFEDV